MPESLDRIKTTYGKYINDPKYVYCDCIELVHSNECDDMGDVCSSHYKSKINEWLIILEKVDDPLDYFLLNKQIVDHPYALFMAEQLKVVLIFDKNNCQLTIDKVSDACNNYVVGEMVTSTCNTTSKNLTREFEYYKSIDRAFYNHTKIGKSFYWYDDGSKHCCGEYFNGKRIGKWIYWHKNGMKSSEGYYMNNNKTGKWVYYDENGKIVKCKKYKYYYSHL